MATRRNRRSLNLISLTPNTAGAQKSCPTAKTFVARNEFLCLLDREEAGASFGLADFHDIMPNLCSQVLMREGSTVMLVQSLDCLGRTEVIRGHKIPSQAFVV